MIETFIKPMIYDKNRLESAEQKDTETRTRRTCRACRARIVGFYNGIGEWKYCPYCGAKL